MLDKDNLELLKSRLLGCGVLALIALLLTVVLFATGTLKLRDNDELVINMDSYEFVDIGVSAPKTNYVMSEEEFESFKSSNTTMSFETYEEYLVGSDASFSSESTVLSDDSANAMLYSYADKYFTVYYGEQRISPIFPMAVANVETPSRADFNVTWSALFPSAYVDVSEMGTFDVTGVVSDSTLFSVLGKDYSTRDRGALQMNPTYGTGNAYYNSMMSASEKTKLSNVDYSGYESWVSGASSASGDRFYLPDVCLRMSAAMETQVSNIAKNNYSPATDMQLLAMMAMGHQSGSVWAYKDHNKSIGKWRSGELAYKYAYSIGTSEFISAVSEYASTHEATYISSGTAKKIYESVYSEPFSTYASKDIVCTYPIKVLYAYIKLCILYTQ